MYCWCTVGVQKAKRVSQTLLTFCVLLANPLVFKVEPRGLEPLASAVQRRHHTLLELSVECKTAAKARISFMTLFPSFQVIYSGCCTVAAHLLPSIPRPYAFTVALIPLKSAELMDTVALPVLILSD